MNTRTHSPSPTKSMFFVFLMAISLSLVWSGNFSAIAIANADADADEATAVQKVIDSYPTALFHGKTQNNIRKELPISRAYRDETTPIEEEIEVIIDGTPTTKSIVRYLTEMEIFQYRGDVLWTCIVAVLVFLAVQSSWLS